MSSVSQLKSYLNSCIVRGWFCPSGTVIDLPLKAFSCGSYILSLCHQAEVQDPFHPVFQVCWLGVRHISEICKQHLRMLKAPRYNSWNRIFLLPSTYQLPFILAPYVIVYNLFTRCLYNTPSNRLHCLWKPPLMFSHVLWLMSIWILSLFVPLTTLCR